MQLDYTCFVTVTLPVLLILKLVEFCKGLKILLLNKTWIRKLGKIPIMHSKYTVI